ncbi:hypothetical protein [Burkholderia pseudomallei]|uniref:hypothetical protein n=1 Tax=Burkholderia pseudomallei TaxID=28450 RepID=UPI0011C4C524|nr:hypothetical protein [Burkholderia pseudomallei]
MNRILYQEFLDDSAIYRANRAYWFAQFWPKRRMANEGNWSARDERYRRRYKPYLSEKFNNNVFYEDGNPIFNLWNTETGHVARIVQLGAKSDADRYFQSFKQKIEMAPIRTQEILQLNELVVILILSAEVAADAIGQVRIWLG